MRQKGALPPGHQSHPEKAIRDGILKPSELERLFSSTDSIYREVVVQPLLESGKLTASGASALTSLRNSQLNSLSQLSRTNFNNYVELMNNPTIAKEDIGALLSRPKDKRASFETLLFGDKTLPAPEISAKILKNEFGHCR